MASLPINSLVPNPYQPRIKFDEAKLKELSETIQNNGLIQPIVVRRQAGRYEIVSGERRWQASKLAGLDTVTVIIKSYDDKAMLEAALIENIEREDLNCIEIAKAVKSLQDRFQMTQDEVARRLSKDRSTISNLCRLLTLPDEVQKLLLDGKIEFGHAKAILSVQNELNRRDLAFKISEGGWSVRRAEAEAKRLNEHAPDGSGESAPSNPYVAIEEEFSRHFGTEVRLKLGARGGAMQGRIEIRVQSNDDINRVLGIARKGAVANRIGGIL